MKPTANGLRRFLLVRDDFYSDPEGVRRIAQSMKFEETGDITGFMTSEVYHPAGVRQRLERVLGVKITRWDQDPDEGNGIFYQAFSRGSQKETPGVHSDEPYEDITVLIYLTPGLPIDCGTSLWQHRATGLVNAPTQRDARRLKTTLTKLRDRLEVDSEKRQKWIEIDRAGYRFNRMVAYASGMLHSASRHYGSNLRDGRIYQTFRIGVDWSSCRLYA
ncbi:MAG: hypothetical protein QOF14_1564 [Hyphomicrobiales bacterium]|jgi:hypothetical protein|nr:hypothetical protein [Hyphomicrobiales bacterium]